MVFGVLGFRVLPAREYSCSLTHLLSQTSLLTPLGGRARERFGKPALPPAEREDVQTHFAEILLLGKQEIDAPWSQATEQSMLEMSPETWSLCSNKSPMKTKTTM